MEEHKTVTISYSKSFKIDSVLYLAKLMELNILYFPSLHFVLPFILINLKYSVYETTFISVIKKSKYCTHEELTFGYLRDL